MTTSPERAPDVAVVGGGNAALVAALEARAAGASVLMLAVHESRTALAVNRAEEMQIQEVTR